MRVNKFQQAFAAAVMVFGLSAHAADFITFDPTGVAGASGDLTQVSAFDWVFGNALADGVNSATGITAGTSFTTYYQANLGTVVRTGTDWLNGTGGTYFTAVAAFGETVTTCTGGPPCTNADFSFSAAGPNYFKIYAVSSEGIDLTGAGFTGTAILTGTIIADGFSSNFNVSSSPTAQTLCNGSLLAPSANCLDRSPDGNDWGTTSTVSGSGGSSIQIIVDSALANYFPDLSVGSVLSLSFFNTSQVLPYNQTNPSRYLANATADGQITSDIGAINGAPIGLGGGADVLFQADANQSFTRAAVPEPGSLALVGLGLIGAVGATRRRRNAS